jgi:hypothetical protein
VDEIDDLAGRWTRARTSALSPARRGEPEAALLPEALGTDREGAERRVFDHSLRLGEGFRRFHAATIPLDDLPEVLAQIAARDAPCLAGTWKSVPGEAAVCLERSGCVARALGPGACDYWREAVSGLVLGLTGLRHARHASVTRGDAHCVDVIYADPESVFRFGPIPEEMRAGLAAVARTVAIFDSAVTVRFRGLSEGVLYYELEQAGCGPSPLRARPLLEQGVQRRFPALALKEISPRPVLEDH